MSCGADPDGDSWNGKKFYAPLLVAASRQDKAMAELLLAYGAEKEAKEPVRYVNGVKVGRNAPCPYGSGKKFKKCCGRGL